jgi:hypothetical protein
MDQTSCPANLKWLTAMYRVIPAALLEAKLGKYKGCLPEEVRRELRLPEQEALPAARTGR